MVGRLCHNNEFTFLSLLQPLSEEEKDLLSSLSFSTVSKERPSKPLGGPFFAQKRSFQLSAPPCSVYFTVLKRLLQHRRKEDKGGESVILLATVAWPGVACIPFLKNHFSLAKHISPSSSIPTCNGGRHSRRPPPPPPPPPPPLF